MSVLTLRNTTAYIAMFKVLKGEQLIGRIPGIAPGALLEMPSADTYQVIASTIIEGNTYTSAPMDVVGATAFLAQMKQLPAPGTYEFEVVQSHSSRSDQLQFQTTTRNPVTFTLMKGSLSLQNVVVNDAFVMEVLTLGDTFHIHAVINGITTGVVTTTHPNAVITATVDGSQPGWEYFVLEVG